MLTADKRFIFEGRNKKYYEQVLKRLKPRDDREGAFTGMPDDGKEPFIDAYLIVMGIVIITKAFGKRREAKSSRFVYPLGFIGGFCDAVGGGGWGPVVTSTMLATGHEPRKTIGSVNAAEFFVTVAETTAFAAALISDFERCWQILLGLVVGGVLAAPIAAWLCSKVKVKPLMIAVGALVIALNVFNLIAWFK